MHIQNKCINESYRRTDVRANAYKITNCLTRRTDNGIHLKMIMYKEWYNIECGQLLKNVHSNQTACIMTLLMYTVFHVSDTNVKNKISIINMLMVPGTWNMCGSSIYFYDHVSSLQPRNNIPWNKFIGIYHGPLCCQLSEISGVLTVCDRPINAVIWDKFLFPGD